MQTQKQSGQSFRRVRNGAITTIALSGLLIGGGVAIPAVAQTGAQQQPASPASAADAPWTKTVTWLVSQLTATEKVNLIHGSGPTGGPSGPNAGDPYDHGQAGYFAPVARLGIPEIRHADALGINVAADATSSPSRLGLASSFSRDLFSKFGGLVGQEGLDADIDLLYGPQSDLARTPSWSRNNTAYSEDAYVASQLEAPEINGLQSAGLMSQVKHVGMYNGQAQGTVSKVEGQAAHEIYLKPAEVAAETGVSSMMCSYATFEILDDARYTQPDFACHNSVMMKDIIKGDWDFNGFITTDYNAAKSSATLLAGADQEFATSFLTVANLLPLIDPTSATYDPAYLAAANEAVARSLYQLERFGKLDNDHIPAAYQSSVPQTGDVDTVDNAITINKAAGVAAAEEFAERAAVLLKNDGGALPLAASQTVNVVGQTSTVLPASPGGERAQGFGDRVTIAPLNGLKAIGGSKVASNPGIDLLGTTIPAASLKQDAAGTIAGLVRTTNPNNGSPVTTSTDTVLGGNQTNLVRGYTYSWTGYINVPADDTYQIQIQRPYGTDAADPAKYNNGVRRASGGAVSLSIDGANKSLANPDGNILQNAIPSYAIGTANAVVASNGQYMGYDNTGAAVALTPGLHAISLTYTPVATVPATPTVRLAWSAKNAAQTAAVAAAATNDVSVIFADDAGSTGGDGASTSTDVKSLSAAQNTLITQVADAAHAAGKKAVVVLNTGSAIQMPWIDKVDAVLEAWYPGQEGGTASAKLLYGQANPGGHLTLSFPKDSKQSLFGTVDTNGDGVANAGDENWERSNATTDAGDLFASFKWTENLAIGYRWYTDPTENTKGYDPLFAFGHGLSYTNFAYEGLSVKSTVDGGLDVSFTVKNTGARGGYDVPQVYVTPSPDLDAAKFEQTALKLVQFDDVYLDAGASKTLKLHVAPSDLSSYSTENNNWVLGTGNRTVYLGAASDDLRLHATGKVYGDAHAPAVTTDLAATTAATDGKTVSFTAAASGSPTPDVRWQQSTDKGANWTDITGATSLTYSFTAAVAASGTQYRAAFTNEFGVAYTTASVVTVKLASDVTAVLKAKNVKTNQNAVVDVTVNPTAAKLTGTVTVHYGSEVKTVDLVAGDKGKVSVTLPKLAAGTYVVYVSYSGNDQYSADDSVKFDLVVKK